MNDEYYKGLINKNSAYLSHIRGEDYLTSKKVIEINIDNFTKFKGNKFIYEFMMREKDTQEIKMI